MSAGAGGAGAGAGGAAAAAIANAIKASGVLVKMEPEDFAAILDRQETPLVVICEKSNWVRRALNKDVLAHLTSYKGLAFYCETPSPLDLPAGTEVVVAEKIYIPSM